MKNEFIKQYEHTWKVFERIVINFDNDAWIHAGRRSYTPVRLAFHILKSTKYYIEDSSTFHFASGITLESEWETTPEDNLPTQNDIVVCINELKVKAEGWLSEMDFSAKNTSFDWAGETKLGVVIFLLRHTLYHLGELSCLLNESRNGDVEDIYVKA